MPRTVEIDARPFEQATERMLARVDQLPFVFSNLINDALFKARQVLIEHTWPQHVTVRNKSFLAASLRVKKSTKATLQGSIVDVLHRGHLMEHARGGTTRPMHAKKFAIPTDRITRTARGVAAGQKPSELMALAQTQPTGRTRKPKGFKVPRGSQVVIRVTDRGIYLAQRGLHLLYSRVPQVQMNADVPFFEDFDYVTRAAMRTGFADQMRRAMQTAR